MKRPAVFFDRDNTLIACDEFLGDPSKVALVDGAADAVARARELGFVTVIFSNQSGVARGYFPEEAVHSVNTRLDEMLADANPKAVIDRHEFCPFHPEASIEKYRQDSHLRKPRPGMIHQAAEALALDLSRSWVIGDAPRDIEAGHAAGCRTILFTDSKLKASPAALAEKMVEPDYICSTLAEAMDFIERNTSQPETGGGEDMSNPVGATTATVEEPSGETPAKPDAPRPLTSIEKLKLKGEAQRAVAVDEVGTTVATSSSSSNEVTARASQATRLNESAPAAPPSTSAATAPKLESIALDILHELRRRHEQPQQDFSVSKLLAGVAQIIVLAMLFLAFLNRSNAATLTNMLLFALTLQAMTIALLIMGRQR
jgi:D-glycero-D-manno-heptose 1,7-bisphosphate phosphatase